MDMQLCLLWACPSLIMLPSKLPGVWQLTFKCTSLQALLAFLWQLVSVWIFKEMLIKIIANHSVAHQEQGLYQSCTAACVNRNWAYSKVMYLWAVKYVKLMGEACIYTWSCMTSVWNQPTSKPQKSKVAMHISTWSCVVCENVLL